MINYNMQLLEHKILNIINTSDVPIGSIFFILKGILYDIEKLYSQQIDFEIKQQLQDQDQVVTSEKEYKFDIPLPTQDVEITNHDLHLEFGQE